MRLRLEWGVALGQELVYAHGSLPWVHFHFPVFVEPLLISFGGQVFHPVLLQFLVYVNAIVYHNI